VGFYTNNLHIGISGCVEFFVDGGCLNFAWIHAIHANPNWFLSPRAL